MNKNWLKIGGFMAVIQLYAIGQAADNRGLVVHYKGPFVAPQLSEQLTMVSSRENLKGEIFDVSTKFKVGNSQIRLDGRQVRQLVYLKLFGDPDIVYGSEVCIAQLMTGWYWPKKMRRQKGVTINL